MGRKVISRSNFFMMTLMMAALLFLFQFTEVVKDNWNEYGVNEYLTNDAGPGKAQAWSQPEGVMNSDVYEDGAYVVLIGRERDQGIADMAVQWCEYTKRPLLIYSDLESSLAAGADQPEMLLLDAACLDFEQDTEQLAKLSSRGVPLVFCSLPKPEVIENNRTLKDLLGVKSIKTAEMDFLGIHLFEGFLLGGEVIYQAETEADQAKQDLELDFPWYVLGSGTKVYMAGIIEQTDPVKAEAEDEDALQRTPDKMPPVIWRNSVRGNKVFAVNGPYMQNNTGIGILSAMTAELYPYEIYPVVNAQNMAIVNYPGLASENEEMMQKLYSRGQREVMRDIVWPGMDMVLKQSGNKITCLMMPQFDYEDEILPKEADYVYYLKLLKELKGEAGWSLDHGDEISAEEKMQQDTAFFEGLEDKYPFGSVYADREDLGQLPENIRTVISDYADEQRVLGYIDETITLQSATADGFEHTYSDNFRARSLETALGYSNIIIDMNEVLWPESDEGRWELLYDEFSRNTITYWKPFQSFDQTVLLESDRRVRDFMALDFDHVKKENIITLQIHNMGQKSWFILRTHGEDVEAVDGGTWKQLEKNVYLIEADRDHVEIQLSKKTNTITLEP